MHAGTVFGKENESSLESVDISGVSLERGSTVVHAAYYCTLRQSIIIQRCQGNMWEAHERQEGKRVIFTPVKTQLPASGGEAVPP